MTPERFSECLETIGWTQRGLAARLEIDEHQTRRWASGRYPVPGPVATWLERLTRTHERNPAPDITAAA